MLQKLRSAINELGFSDALVYCLDQAIRRTTGAAVLFRYALVVQPVPDRPLLPPRRGREIEVRLFLQPDPVLTAAELTPAIIAYRFDQGAVCFGAFKGGSFVGCLWVCLGPYEEDEVRCRFVPLPAQKSCWDLGMYIAPDQRGGLVFARLWDEANAYLRERGVKWTLSRIGIANMSSLGSHARIGARRFATATYLCFGPAQVMLTALRPCIRFSLGRASRPELPLLPPAAKAGSGA